MHRKDFLAETKARGKKLNPGTSEGQAAIQNGFLSLDPKEKARYETLSSLTEHRRFLPVPSGSSSKNQVDILKIC